MAVKKSSIVNRVSIGLTFVAVFAAALLLVGCGDSPTGVQNGNTALDALHYADDVLSQPANERRAKFFLNVSSDESASPIDGSGGAVSVDLRGNVCALEVPANALDESVNIEMEAFRISTPWGETTVFEFHPEGLEFMAPATLDVATDKADGARLNLHWWNPDSARWEFQGSDTVESGRVDFKLHHFSKYGIS